uniref:Uncharacterized protein n=1 Tax=Rhizophora mucronata TaxID=61149 RepID=A0A2P2P8H2_RHIMU
MSTRHFYFISSHLFLAFPHCCFFLGELSEDKSRILLTG